MTVTDKWPPPPGPLPDTTGWPVPQVEALALERCQARRDTQRRDITDHNKPMACKRCMTEALMGEDLTLAAGPVDLADLYRKIPKPATGWSVTHERLMELLAPRRELELRQLMEATGATETNCSARLRDLRQFGYPITRRMEAGRPLYGLGA